MKSDLLSTLSERGFVNQCTDLDGLDALAVNPLSGYIGFDLTADSLHVGSLIQIMALRWMRTLGHDPIVLLGEATTRIGDPTGKTEARPVLSSQDIFRNRVGITKVFDNLLPAATFVSNNDWLNDKLGLFSYLEEFGSVFTVNRMTALDIVRTRLESQQPMSFLEFNYVLFQSIDFLRLFQRRNVRLQLGGSDQWGNIVNGVDLVRRKTGEAVFGLTTPLMTNAAGEKMGKTAGGAIWLDPNKTNPFDFWQFWRNVEDAKVGEFLGLFTELHMDEVRRLAALQGAEINEAKKVLATEVTRLVHGDEAAEQARADAQAVFENGALAVGIPAITISAKVAPIVADLFMEAGLVSSKSEAARLAAQSGLKMDGVPVTDTRVRVSLLPGVDVNLAVGRKRLAVVRVID